MVRILCLLGVVTLYATTAQAQAQHTHHNAEKQLGRKINQNGKHVLHDATHHTVHAHVANGKIRQVTGMHKATGREVKARKFKAQRQHHASLFPLGGVDRLLTSMGLATESTPTPAAASANPEIVFIGFAFFEGNQLFIYWFPINIVEGGDDGCDPYPPV